MDFTVFKKCWQPITDIAKDEKGDLIADSHSILIRWRNHFSQLLNENMVSDVRQTEIQTADQPVLEPNAFSFEMATEH